jgi:ferredoxin--NADP+ reductase
MAFVITQACCNDAGCATACPVDCIHPTPDDPNFGHTEMLYIDPSRCIDCAACAEVCPVDAIFPDDELPTAFAPYASLNAGYFVGGPPPVPQKRLQAHQTTDPLAVAVVGAGPSGFYAADALLDAGPHVTVSLIDRLPTPFGLVRAGVAPDHQDTKEVTRSFAMTAAHPRVRTYFNVEVGVDVPHSDLLAHHHAVIYATGAFASRRPGIPRDDLPGSFSATELVGWYNGHPDYTDVAVSAHHPTAVVIGNGNVALDVARILLLGERAGHTDIADHAREALCDNAISDVIVLGRRGPEHAAFSFSQLLALDRLDGIDVIVDSADLINAALPPDQYHAHAYATSKKIALLTEMAARKPRHTKRIHLRFATSVREIVGVNGVEAVHVTTAGADTSVIPAGIVVSCIGFDGQPVAGIAFDNSTKRIPNRDGRVIDPTGQVVAGQYVTGWIKRGPSGVIGTNKVCAAETVDALLDDHRRGLLPVPSEPPAAFADHLVRRGITPIDRGGWLRIDDHERRQGRRCGRPRRKLVDRNHMIALAVDTTVAAPPTPSTDQPRRTL